MDLTEKITVLQQADSLLLFLPKNRKSIVYSKFLYNDYRS